MAYPSSPARWLQGIAFLPCHMSWAKVFWFSFLIAQFLSLLSPQSSYFSFPFGCPSRGSILLISTGEQRGMGLDNAALRGSELGACLPNFSASAFWGFPVKPRKSPSSISAINPIYLSIYLTFCLSVCLSDCWGYTHACGTWTGRKIFGIGIGVP